jgi:positive regulator of sigma E activity
MDRSLFLARLIGPTFVAIALGMLINLGLYESMIAEALHSGILFYLSGLLSLLAGLAIVNLHNTWCADWRVIITVLGWLMTIGGIIRIVVPQVAIAIGSTIYGGRAPTIVVALIVGTLGAFLSFKGYGRRA